MVDREKVIKGLECCIPSRDEEKRKIERLDRHLDCPYRPYASGDYGCFWELMADALTLLKAQETVVRCGDCKYCFAEGFVHEHNICKKHEGIQGQPDDWYCADGKRDET